MTFGAWSAVIVLTVVLAVLVFYLIEIRRTLGRVLKIVDGLNPVVYPATKEEPKSPEVRMSALSSAMHDSIEVLIEKRRRALGAESAFDWG